MKCKDCGKVSRSYECSFCKTFQAKFDLAFQIKERQRWKTIEARKECRRQMTKQDAEARERRKREERIEAEADRLRKQAEMKDFTAKSEMNFRLGVEKMFDDIGYEGDSGYRYKESRSKRFYERRRKIVFTANELTVREKHCEKMKVFYYKLL